MITLNKFMHLVGLSASHDFVSWRRGWDSNPRGSFGPPSRFRVDPVATTSVPLRSNNFFTAEDAERAEKNKFIKNPFLFCFNSRRSLRSLWLIFLSSFLEEPTQHLPGFFQENARSHLYSMVQAFIL